MPVFITPMAAVAGSVAEEILAAMVAAANLVRAYVNNGGDIALHLARRPVVPHRRWPASTSVSLGAVEITAADPVRGIATSGRGGRSFSLGIADAVTVLADTASKADAAATLIGNAVDLPGHPADRAASQPAGCSPTAILATRLVTVHVGPLTRGRMRRRLERGLR